MAPLFMLPRPCRAGDIKHGGLRAARRCLPPAGFARALIDEVVSVLLRVRRLRGPSRVDALTLSWRLAGG